MAGLRILAPRLAGKTVVITGGTGGIGLQSALGIAKTGARVLVTTHLDELKALGIADATASFDFADVMERVQRVITAVEPHDSVERYTELGVECLQGSARITSPWTVEVQTTDRARTLTT